MWHIYVTHLCDTFMWHIYVTHLCDTFMWHIYVTHLCDTFMWHIYVTHLCDTFMWHIYVTHLCDTFMWHIYMCHKPLCSFATCAGRMALKKRYKGMGYEVERKHTMVVFPGLEGLLEWPQRRPLHAWEARRLCSDRQGEHGLPASLKMVPVCSLHWELTVVPGNSSADNCPGLSC